MIDNIITWSGWLIALSLFIVEIIRYLRNRYKVSIYVSLEPIRLGVKEKIVVIEASNTGRRPINLTAAGLFFEKETVVLSDELNIKVGWVYKKLPIYSFV